MEEEFQAHMRFLAENAYRTVFLSDWVRGHVVPDAKTLAITFDDGYLDNWVYAFPVLKKYGLKATVFVCTERPVDGAPLRMNLEDVWTGRCERSGLPPNLTLWEANRGCVLREGGSPDFMNWNELRAMQASGLVDIQSHAQYHRSFFLADQILDFNQNLDEQFDLGWATDGDTRYGIPVYPRRSAMSARRYFDDRGLRDYLADRVKGPEFFRGRRRQDYLRELTAWAEAYRRTHKLRDHYETPEECEQRIETELAVSKQTIESKLGKACDLIAWPWGHHDKLSLRLAKRVGYGGAVAFVPGANVKGSAGGTWDIKRYPAPGDVAGLERCLRIYSSPYRAAIDGWRRRWKRKRQRVAERAKDGQFYATVKRKLVHLLADTCSFS